MDCDQPLSGQAQAIRDCHLIRHQSISGAVTMKPMHVISSIEFYGRYWLLRVAVLPWLLRSRKIDVSLT
jgi:hypothetical protein